MKGINIALNYKKF